jgi:hypothetical protein
MLSRPIGPGGTPKPSAGTGTSEACGSGPTKTLPLLKKSDRHENSDVTENSGVTKIAGVTKNKSATYTAARAAAGEIMHGPRPALAGRGVGASNEPERP